jgi:serine/threonine-protein kinase HipA
MRPAPETPLRVALAFAPTDVRQAGRLALEAGLAQLEWSREVIAAKSPVSPIYYPPEPGLLAARSRSFDGVHGVLADSLPESWGHLVMSWRLAKMGVDIDTLSVVERLALVGDRGRGALVYNPAEGPADEIETLDLDILSQEAATLMKGAKGCLIETLACLAGESGGARPKVQVGLDGRSGISAGHDELPPGYAPWLVKFRGASDPVDIGPIEEAYANMAQAAGLVVSAHRLLQARDGPGYFATRRFDRPDGGGRLHMVSLAGAIEAPSDAPSSYDLFLTATQAITRRADDVAAAFRRMIFNILSCNRDDHTRQHAYLMTSTGDWRLAPAFDLTYSTGLGGEHYLDIAGERRRPTRVLVMDLGKRHGFDPRHVVELIKDVATAVADWPRWARAAGVTHASTKTIGDAHARVLADFKIP